MSKMGISIISSYRGGYNFEAVGLSRSMAREYFPGLVISRISGIGLTGIKNKVKEMHATGLCRGRSRYPVDRRLLPLPPRRRAPRAWKARMMHQLQQCRGH